MGRPGPGREGGSNVIAVVRRHYLFVVGGVAVVGVVAIIVVHIRQPLHRTIFNLPQCRYFVTCQCLYVFGVDLMYDAAKMDRKLRQTMSKEKWKTIGYKQKDRRKVHAET